MLYWLLGSMYLLRAAARAHFSFVFLERCPSVCPPVRLSVHMSVCQPTKIILWLIFLLAELNVFFRLVCSEQRWNTFVQRNTGFQLRLGSRCVPISLFFLSLLRLFRSNVNSRCFQRSRFRLESLRLETTTNRGPSLETCSRTLILTDFEHFKKKGSTEI
jgi:hypothetical protein